MDLDSNFFLSLGLTQNGDKPVKTMTINGFGGTVDKWHSLFQDHFEGEGPFGGRNNTLVKVIAFLRAKNVPEDFGRFITHSYNVKHLHPSLDERVVEEMFTRLYATWEPGNEPDVVTDALKERRLLTIDQLLAITEDPDKQFKWIAKGLIQQEGITVLSGQSGHGKTWLALELIRHLVRGEDEEYSPFLGKYDLDRLRCVYFDEENGEALMGDRIKLLGFRGGHDRFLSWSDSTLRLEIPKDRAEIKSIIADHGAGMVVFDSLKAFHGRDENSATEMRRVGDWLKEVMLAGVCVIALHHDKKGTGIDTAQQDKTRGSGDITAFSQSVLGLEKKNGIYYFSKRKIRGAENDEAVISYLLSIDKKRDGCLYFDLDGAATKEEDDRELRQEEALQRKVQRVQRTIDDLTTSGIPINAKNIARASGMSMRDITEARKSLATNDTSARYDMNDDD